MLTYKMHQKNAVGTEVFVDEPPEIQLRKAMELRLGRVGMPEGYLLFIDETFDEGGP